MPRRAATPAATSPADAAARELRASAEPGQRLTVDRPLWGRSRFTVIPPTTGDLLKEARGDDVTLETLAAMRGDSTIAAGLRLMATPIMSHVRRAMITCDDPQVKRFVEARTLDNGLLYAVTTACVSALWAGCSIQERVWETEDLELTYDDDQGQPRPAWNGPALVYGEVAAVNPLTVPYFTRDDQGRLDGFTQNTAQGPTPVGPAKAFVFTHDQEFGNHWGRPRIRDAYAWWLWKQFLVKAWMLWAEKKAQPSKIGYYPPGLDRTTQTDNQRLMTEVLQCVEQAGGVAFPNVRTSAPDGRDAGPAWLLQELKSTDTTGIFLQTFQALCTEILRSMFVPERVFQEGQFGTKAEAEQHTDIFLLTLDAFLYALVTALERGIIAPLVLVNFGSKAAPARLEVEGLTEDERSLLHDILLGLLSTPQAQAVLDIRAIAERRGVPVNPEPGAPAAGASTLATPGAPASPGDPPNLALDELPRDELVAALDEATRMLALAGSGKPVPPVVAPQPATPVAPTGAAHLAARVAAVRAARDALQAAIIGLPRAQIVRALPAHGLAMEQQAPDQATAEQVARDLAAAHPDVIYTVLQAGQDWMVVSQPVDLSGAAPDVSAAKADKADDAAAAGTKPTALSDVVAAARAQIDALLAVVPEEERDAALVSV